MIDLTDAAFSAAIRACVTDSPCPWTDEATRQLQDDYHRHELKKEALLMELGFSKLTLDDDENFIAVGEQVMDIFDERKPVALFHFTNKNDRDSAMLMCDLLIDKKQADKLYMRAGDANGVAIIAFADFDSEFCHIFSFMEEADCKTACRLAERMWLLSHSDDCDDFDD